MTQHRDPEITTRVLMDCHEVYGDAIPDEDIAMACMSHPNFDGCESLPHPWECALIRRMDGATMTLGLERDGDVVVGWSHSECPGDPRDPEFAHLRNDGDGDAGNFETIAPAIARTIFEWLDGVE